MAFFCMRMSAIRHLLLPLVVLFFVEASAMVGALNVSYDHRAMLLDGKRRLLISAGIHYPRATPEMWPDLVAKAKEGGANVVQTYVFWSGHEPQKGQYNFKDRYDLAKFVRIVGEAGLYLNLRIGPYVCAEWNFGGFPTWLRDVPGIEFRTDNEPFKDEMATFVKVIVDLMKENKLFAWQGGPIILAQIENEYGNIEWEYQEAGKRYIQWAAEFAVGLKIGVPWIMCQQWDAPPNVIETCNGYYCDGYKPGTPGAPIMWTEDWNGWFLNWGSHLPHRPVQDNAFAVARFYQRGGSYQNYYMYFGGTNFERTSATMITTSYDYDAPLDEYGLISQPKWGHLKELHEVLYLIESALFASDAEPENFWFGPNLEAHVYSDTSPEGDTCVAFLANIGNWGSSVVDFRGRKYEIPAWSVSILPDCKTVVFNTAKIGAQTTVMNMKKQRITGIGGLSIDGTAPNGLSWESHEEPVGARDEEEIIAESLLEQIKTTKDLTDYLWYVTRFEVSKDDADKLTVGSGQVHLELHEVRDALHIFVNGELVGSATGTWIHVDQPVSVHEGVNEIALLSMTLGLTNYGAFLEKEGAGIRGTVKVVGLPSGDKDLTSAKWVHQVGLKGESMNLFTSKGAASVKWLPAKELPLNKSMIWYKTTFPTPRGNDPVTLDLGSMGKGQLFVNGYHLGRYWPTIFAPEWGCTDSCDYRGAYYPEKCVTQCGQPTQRWYHIPREWLEKDDDNLLVLFEEMGGDPSKVSIATRSQETICGHVSDSHPPPVSKWIQSSKLSKEHQQKAVLPEVRLECSSGRKISHIVFASFGNSTGTCGKFQKGSCHASVSTAVIEKACKGKSQCAVPVSAEEFGEDPCPGYPKSLTVQAICRASDESPTESFVDEEYLAPVLNSNRWQRGPSLLKDSKRWQTGPRYGKPSWSIIPDGDTSQSRTS
ncbi:unnamed protein product [Calypogeia fissa]